jgi:proliferating cell nuclear antigen
MFEALLANGLILKKIIESIKELVTEVNIEVTAEAISLQAMDASHVALVALVLRASEFEEYRCDHPQTLGISITNLAKLLKIAGNDDSIILRAEDEATVLTLVFTGKNNEKTCEFNLNLLTLDSEHLGIPEQDYAAEIQLSSAEFSRICRELTQVTDTLNLSVDKEAVKFAVSGDLGAGSITMRANSSDKADERLMLNVHENVGMAFALRYLNLFNKASSLSDEVSIALSPEVPMVVKFAFTLGELKYFLAPKISEDA